jgi:hypothetical protein
MWFIDGLLGALSQVSSLQLAAVMALSYILTVAIVDRRASVALCWAQWLLLGLSALPVLFRPVVLVRLAVTTALGFMLLISSARSIRPGSSPSVGDRDTPARGLSGAFSATMLGDMGLGFRLAAATFGLLMAYGMWRAYPLSFVPKGLDLIFYEMLTLALLMMLTSADLLRAGLGLLTLLHGVQSLYVYLEQSLLVVALWGLVSVVVALAVVHFTDAARSVAVLGSETT